MRFVTLSLLATLFLPALAHAKANSIQVDLDGDGKPDTVTIRDLPGTTADPKTKETLEVTLSSNAQTLSFPNLPGQFYDSCEEGGDVVLTADGANAFRLQALRPMENDECTYGVRQATIAMNQGELRMIRLGYDHWHGHADGYEVTSDGKIEADLVKSRLTVTGSNDKSHTEALNPSCQVSLKALDQSQLLPACLLVQADFLWKEVSREAGSLPVCPALSGNYLCHSSQYPNDAPETKTILARVLNNQLTFDFSEASAPAIADGQRHLYDRDVGPDYMTATCHRNTLKLNEVSWFDLKKGDPRKKWTDLKPEMIHSFTLTQTDLEGKKFTYHEVCDVQDINGKNDGSMVHTCDDVYTCERAER